MIDVYIITNIINGKQYVGISKDGYIIRFNEHLRNARCGVKKGHLYSSIRKYGEENFKTELLCQTDTWENACKLETEFIEKYNTYSYKKNSNGYNCTKGGDGRTGQHSEECKELLRQVMLKKLSNPEYKKEFIKRMNTDEINKKRSFANSGDKNGMYGKGYKVAGPNNQWYGLPSHLQPRYGVKHSDETKQKISEAKKGRPNNVKENNPMYGTIAHNAIKIRVYNETESYDFNNMLGAYTFLKCSFPTFKKKALNSGIIFKGYYVESERT